jgi:hypothetical protein
MSVVANLDFLGGEFVKKTANTPKTRPESW